MNKTSEQLWFEIKDNVFVNIGQVSTISFESHQICFDYGRGPIKYGFTTREEANEVAERLLAIIEG